MDLTSISGVAPSFKVMMGVLLLTGNQVLYVSISPFQLFFGGVEVKSCFNFLENDRVFLMFGSANRDEDIFEQPDEFRLNRDVARSISFGAGPHFCAGAWISKTLIAEVAIPMLFEKFPNIKLLSEVEYFGWAFRGPKPFFVKL